MGMVDTVRYVEKICQKGLVAFLDEVYGDESLVLEAGQNPITGEPVSMRDSEYVKLIDPDTGVSPDERLRAASGGVSFSAQGVRYAPRPTGPDYDVQLPTTADILFPAIVFYRIGSFNLAVADKVTAEDTFFLVDCRCNPMIDKKYREVWPNLWYAAVRLDEIVSNLLVKSQYVQQTSNSVDGFLDKSNVHQVFREIQVAKVPPGGLEEI